MDEAIDSKTLRRYPRRVFRRPIGILARGNYQLSRALQLGEGGMLVEGIEGYATGERVVVTFKVPGRAVVVTKAEIRYVKSDGGSSWGLQFESLPFEQKRLVRHFIASLTSDDSLTD